MEAIVSTLRQSAESLGDGIARWLPSVVSALVIVVLFWAIWRGLRRAAAVAIRHSDLDPTAANFIQTILKYMVLTIGMVAALGKVGINTASILTSLGVAGLTIGFAAKDALSNIISGLFIFWDRPFVIGDLVEVEGKYGRVADITMRSTRVVTPDGKMLAVPNSTVVNTTVASYTNFPHLRLDIPFTIAVTESIGKARDIALDLCHSDKRLMTKPAPEVVVNALGDYCLTLELRAWLDDEKTHIAARHSLREALFEALRSAGVDMPFETLALAPLEIHREPARAA